MMIAEIIATRFVTYRNGNIRRKYLPLLCLVLCHLTNGYTKNSAFHSTCEVHSPIEESETNEQTSKSAIEILYPSENTVWTISEPARIEWKTANIGSNKSIRFFLARDDMVVQELGTFKNTFAAENIKLAKNIGSGDTYQVVGIELFPDNNYQVAKFATPYFSIRNKEADARKNAARMAKAEKPIKEKTKTPDAPMFQGRKISYIKKLVFGSEEISINVWDHGRQDNDIVSIYLNGTTIISKHFLTYRKKHIAFTLDPTKPNELFLYAHNLGKFPPNTVSIELTDGTTTENVILNSDLKSCEAVLITINK